VYDIGYLVGSLTSWAMVAFGLFRLRQVRWRDRGRWALTGAFFFSAVGQLVEVSAVADRLDGLSGMPNLYRLVAYLCAAFIGVSEVLLVTHWTSPEHATRKLRRRLVFSAACVAGYLVVFSIGNDPADPRRFTVDNVRSPAVATFLLIYVAVQISYLGDVAIVAWRFSRVAQRTWMRTGLRIAAIGGAIGVVEALSKASYVALGLAGAHPRGEETVDSVIVMVASVFLLSGWATPALEPRLGAARNWLIRYRGHRALYPLWQALFDAMPAIALEPPVNRWAAVWSPRDVKLRTLRRVIEVRDGRLNLAPYVDPGVADTARRMGTAAGLSGVHLDAVVEAARIRAALAALRREETVAPAADVPAIAGFNELASEIGWLSRVARAFTDSEIVSAAAAAHRDGRRPIPEGAT
jgi:hypothetical protein